MSDERQPPTTPMRGLNPEGLLAHGLQSTRRAGWTPPSLEELQRALPQYEILAFAGRGGMGAVYKARHKRLDRVVAIKVLPADIEHDEAGFAERFEREGKAMARLSHPNIVAVHDAGETSPSTGSGQATGLLYFIMDFIEGTDLQKLVAQRGPLPANEALSIAARVCDALAYAHGKGIVHRDIKPSNVMIDPEGHVKVADFGLARLITGDGTLTASDMIMGTPDYMAPEQRKGMAVDARADIYSLGVMLYEMFCGEVPRGVFDPPSTRVKCDPRIDAIVSTAMQSAPARRFQTTTEMKSAVEELRAPSAVASAVPADRALTAEGRSRRKHGDKQRTLPVVAATLLLLVCASVGGVWWWKHHATPTVAPTPTTPTDSPAAAPIPWTKVEWATQHIGSGEKIIENGRLHLKRNALWVSGQLPGFDRVRNGAIRFRWARALENSGLEIRLREGYGDQHGALLVALTSTYHGLANIQPGSRTMMRENIDWGALPPIGRETFIQLAAVGHRLYAWRDGKFLNSVNLPADLDLAGAFQFQGGEVLIGETELANLDDRSEADALAVLGVASAVPADRNATRSAGTADTTPLPATPKPAPPPPRTLDGWKAHLAQHGVPADRLKVLPDGSYSLTLTNLTVSDLSFLTGMPLSELHIQQTQVRSLEPLRGMRLRWLEAPNAPLTDLAPLAGMPLEELVIGPCEVRDLSVLRGMPLWHVRIGGERIRDWSVLRELPLRNAHMAGRNFTDPSLVLAGKQFDFLAFENSGVTDISALRGQKLLNHLILDYSPITDLSPLAGVPLAILRISGTRVVDLEPIRGMKLKQFWAFNSVLTSIEVLRGMPLQVVALGFCKDLHDLSPLADCPTLEELWIPDEPGDIEFLRKLPKLRYIAYKWNKAPGSDHPAMTAEQFWKEYDARKVK